VPSSVETFELAGPAWLNFGCLSVAAFIFAPMGAVLARAGFGKRRWGDVVLGLAVLVFMVVAVVWIPFEGPARLAVTDSELIIDYRWPRPDRRVALRSLTGVDYHKTLGRGRRRAPRSQTELRILLDGGETLRVRPPGYRAQWENLRAAAVALARRANVRLTETVVDSR
jgi:hypothetical protein